MNPFEIIIAWIKIISYAIVFSVFVGFSAVMIYRSFIQPWYIMFAMWFVATGIVFLAKRLLVNMQDEFEDMNEMY